MPCRKNPQKVHGMPIPILSWSGLGKVLQKYEFNCCYRHPKKWLQPT